MSALQPVVVIPGDGIGPEITECVLRVLKALDAPFDYLPHLAGLAADAQGLGLLPETTIAAIEAHRLALKGPLTTPIGEGFTSINVALRKRFDLYANVRPAISFPGTKARYDQINLITVRENTEGAYGGEGAYIAEDGSFAVSQTKNTRKGCMRIARFAFELARREGRRKVTIVHKANILKSTSGLFLRLAREVAADYPDIQTQEMIVDNTCMQLVMNPHQFDVLVTTNLFGDIVSDLCAGLVGGLGLAPGANIGEQAAIFEAVHGSAPDIAGKRIANPSALLLAAAMMCSHVGRDDLAQRIRNALSKTMAAHDRTTPDLGGSASCDQFTDALITRL